jgi:copper chaperone NosL
MSTGGIATMRALLRAPLQMALIVAAAACARGGPEPIPYGAADCRYCLMRISDRRYGVEIVTGKGKVLFFDSIECAAAYVASMSESPNESTVDRHLWVNDFTHPGVLVPVEHARFLRATAASSPMGRGLLAVATIHDTAAVRARMGGTWLAWHEVVAEARRHLSSAAEDAHAPSR